MLLERIEDCFKVNDPVKFDGIVSFVIYQGNDNFMVFTVTPNQKISGHYIDEIGVFGAALGIKEGAKVEISGVWTKHPKYGMQVKLKSCNIEKPTSRLGIINYLSSGLIKGIGTSTAEKIYKKFGNDTYKIMDNEPERLSEIPGLGKKKIERITKSWKEQHEGHAVIKFFAEYDVTAAKAIKIYKTFGNNTIEKVTENPYCLEEISGIGFKEADKIALNIGIPEDSPFRIQGCIKHLMNDEIKSNGHSYLYYDKVIKMTRDFIPQVDESSIKNEIEELITSGKLIGDKDGDNQILYLPKYFSAENTVAKHLIMLTKEKPRFNDLDIDVESLDQKFKKQGIEYDVAQLKAIQKALTNKVFVLTGGPGTGKTTTINGIIQMFGTVRSCEILCAAPTGRAAKRMSEATGLEAMTIHRLLEYSGITNEFQRDESDPLEGDVLIVDEFSMVDILLMESLVKAIPPHMHLIIVGDTNQLPSVGPGKVLKDIIDSKCFECVELTKIFRQAESSLIVTNAHAINRGAMPTLPAPNVAGADCVMAAIDDNDPFSQQTAAKWTVEYVTKLLPDAFGIDPTEIQVLIPMHKGEAGVDNINTALQNALNPNGQIIKKGFKTLRVGDKVMQTSNNYEKGVFNGTVGFIRGYDKEDQIVTIEFDGAEVEYELEDLDEITLAYAITIHKSQGSEYPIVVMPIINAHYIMLKRNLLYTGLTRAKKMMLIVGQPKAIAQAVRTIDTKKRNSKLAIRIKEQ